MKKDWTFELIKGDDGAYYRTDGTRVTNTSIDVTEEDIESPEGEARRCYVIELHSLNDSKIDRHERLTYTRLRANKIYDELPVYFFERSLSKSECISVLETIFINELESKPPLKVIERRQGYYLLEGKHLIGILGERIYGDVPQGICVRSTSGLILKNYKEDSKKELDWFNAFIQCGMPQTALLVSGFNAHVEPLISLRGITEKFSVVVLSKTGSGKTAHSSLITDFYKGDFKGCSLTSDKDDFFNTIDNHGSAPLLVEELNETTSDSLKNKNERLFVELVQCFSNLGTKVIKNKRLLCYASPIFTAEYMVDTNSTINRCFIIDFEQEFDPFKLTWLQENQTYFVSFVNKFRHWMCKSYDRYKDIVPNWKIEPYNVSQPLAYAGLSRVKRTYENLMIIIEVLLSFLKEEYHLLDNQLQSLRKRMQKAIEQCIYNTLSRLSNNGDEEDTCYVDVFLNMIDCSYTTYVTDDFSEYKKSQKYDIYNRKIILDVDEYFCITGENLCEYFSAQEDFPYKITKQAIADQMKHYGLLKIRQGERSYIIDRYGAPTGRFYHIHKSVVLELLNEKLYETWHGRLTFDTIKEFCQ